MNKWIVLSIVLLVFFCFGISVAEGASAEGGSFWTPEIQKLSIALLVCLLLMIVLPMTIHVVDEQLGYFFLMLGGAILAFAIYLGVVNLEHGYFVQPYMAHPEKTMEGHLKKIATLKAGSEELKKEVHHLEELLSHVHHRLNHKDHEAFLPALQGLLGKENVSLNEKEHKIALKEMVYKTDPASMEQRYAQQFVDKAYVENHPHHLTELLKEPWLLLLCFFILSVLAVVYQKGIESQVSNMTTRMKPEVMVFWFTLIVGSLGSISVVVIATIGGIFFNTLRKVTHKNYTIPVICFSGNIGISALLTTVGEPLSLFVARNLGEGTPYLMKTFLVAVVLNSIFLSIAAWFFAARAPESVDDSEAKMVKEVEDAKEAIQDAKKSQKSVTKQVERIEKEGEEAVRAVESFEKEHHNFAHELDRVLHNTAKLAFFVWGLLLFGEGVKPIAAELVTYVPPLGLFFANSISAVADNALLGLLEVQAGMSQITVFIMTLSLAFWGVAMVPGNVCNIVLKEAFGIEFGTWAKYGIPLAVVLCAFNFGIVLLAQSAPALFFPFGQ